MMKSPVTLIVNLSLRSIRVLVIDNSGKKIYEDWLPIRTYINGLSVEQDPNEWYESLMQLFKKISSQPALASTIAYITVTSSSLCLVALDKKGSVVGQALMVSDKRAIKESKELYDTFPDFFQNHRGFKAEPSFMLPKIWWLKKNTPHVFSKIRYFLSSNDFLLHRLSGVIITDELNAEKFYYDTVQQTYPRSLLSHIGITMHQLPKVVLPGYMAGKLVSPVQKMLHCRSNAVVIVSTYDAICALIGSSTFQNGELINVCGTCSSYRMFTSRMPSVLNDSFLIQHFSSEGLYMVGGSNNLEGGVLEWAKECFYGDGYLKDDNFLYSLMQKEAQESELGARGIIFIPYLLGERVPFADAYVRGMFFGIERFHTRKDIIRSVFEAVGFQARFMIDEFGKNGIELTSIIMSGGVSKMPLAAKLRADILGLPVHVLSETETTALGAYILTLRARKQISSIRKAKQLFSIRTTIIPNMHNHNAYSSLFVLYKELYTINKELFQKKKEVTDHITQYRKRVANYL